MDNTLLFHIGKMKTGTSALQLFLYENNERLKQYGWCYPDLGKELPEIEAWDVINRGKNGTIFYTKEGRIDESTENWIKPWERIIQYLKDYNVIISSEDIANRDTEKFLELAKKKYKNIKVVIYLRRQDQALESEWNQEVKAGWACDASIQEYISEEVLDRLHYLKQLDQISSIIGKDNLIVKVYEKQQFQGANHTIMSDFLSILSIKPDWNEWVDCFIQNPSLHSNYFEIKKFFNSIYSPEYKHCSPAMYARIFMKLSQEFGEKSRSEGCFTKREREEFLKQFALENEQIARKYLYKNNGILFEDNREYHCLNNEKNFTLVEKDIIRTFSAIILTQNETIYTQGLELERMKKQNNFFAEKLLVRKHKGRDIVFFGAGDRCKKLLVMPERSFNVSFIVDNDVKKCSETLCGVEIRFAKKQIDWSKYFVVITCMETEDIEQQLCIQGLKKEEDYVLAKEYFVYV